MTRILGWIDDRTGAGSFARAALFEHVPGGARWRYVWGSTLTFAFFVQIVTGFVLWANYSPGSQTAWESVYYLQHVVPGGDWLRGIHHYTAQAMIVLLALHMMQVVIDGAYRAPREFNFWVGLVLLQITLGLGLTGYLLPWDQRGYWSTKVATNIAISIPIVGPAIHRSAVGGAEYGHHTLTRFFALHAGLLPLLMIGLIGLHVYLFRRHGLTYKRPKRAADSYFWVDQVFRDSLACLAVMAVIVFLIAWPKLTGRGHYGAELSAPADPSVPYSAARPEWYFLFLFQFLKWKGFAGANEVIGAVYVPVGVFVVLALMPFIGRLRIGHWFNVWFLVSLFTAIVLLTLMAVVQDAGAPAWHVPLLAATGVRFGVVLAAVLLVAMLVLLVLLTTHGHVRAYLRGLAALACIVVGMALLVLWTLTAGSPRLGAGPWRVGGHVIGPQWQNYLLLALLVLGTILLTAGMLREPYSLKEVTSLQGFSHRWQWLHRGRIMLLCGLLAGVIMVTAVNMLDGVGGDAAYRQAVRAAKADAERVMVLAGSPEGIPPSGAVTLLRLDPKTQGPRYFKSNCATCHRYDGHDGTGFVPDPAANPQSAPDLKGFAKREWLAGLLDPKQVDSVIYFGPLMEKAHDGKMAHFVKEDVAEADPAARAELEKIILALSAEAALPAQTAPDQRDAAAINQGQKLIGDAILSCTDCHSYRERKSSKPGRSRGPDLTEYGSREWLIAFVKNPAHPRFYGEQNERMPLYGEKKILGDEAIGLIVDWLRGDWYEPGRNR